MGLHDELVAELTEAFDGDLADAVTDFVGVRKAVGSSASVEDWLNQRSGTDGLLRYSGRGVFSDYSDYELNKDIIQASDKKLICLQKEVQPLKLAKPKFLSKREYLDKNKFLAHVVLVSFDEDFQPKVDDRIDDYTVVRVEPDPVGATYEIQLRRV